jgi:hypothetical protein
MSEVFSLRIYGELKMRIMNEVEVDWANFARGAVEEKVREEKRKNAMKLMDEMSQGESLAEKGDCKLITADDNLQRNLGAQMRSYCKR